MLLACTIAAPLAPCAQAQRAAPAASSGVQPATATVVITGNPLRSVDPVQPSATLGGDALTLRKAATLGETVDGLPGVSGSGFGPNSSRPVIRGLDGDRVRLLDNGGASVDASNLSFDHAPAVDPLVVERIEVLRGPAALMYGGNATGGVVNTIDNRIPRDRIGGLLGRAELRLGGAARERSGAAVLEAGQGPWAWHADAYGRDSDDLRVPRHTPLEEGTPLEPTERVRNSAGRSHGGAVGGAWIGSNARVGLSADTYRNTYGVTVEPDVTIRMRRERFATAGAWQLAGPLAELSGSLSSTRYQHDEVEGTGEIGTRFASRGHDARVELLQQAVGAWRGVSGVQAERLRFSALGEEAFVPGTLTRGQAVFTLQEFDPGPWAVSGGLRAERVRVQSDGDPADATELRFGAPAERSFSPFSATVSGRLRPTPEWTTSLTIGRTERAPAYYELFANGVHVATAAFERGDPDQKLERSTHAEIGARWSRGPHSVSVQAHAMRFANFIALDATGATVDVTDEDGNIVPVPEYLFRGVPARLHGLEIESRWRLLDGPSQLDWSAGLDRLWSRNRATGEPLPRLAPLRIHTALEWRQGPWSLGGGVRHLARQTDVPATDSATPSATLVNLWASWRLRLGGTDALIYARLDNLTNELAYNATAIETVRYLSPLAGRSLAAGLRLNF